MSNIYYDKINFFKEVINNIQIGLNKYKLMNIITSNEVKGCYESLEKIINMINNFNNDNIINELQSINNSLSCIIKNYGVYNFSDLMNICFGNDFISKLNISDDLLDKYDIIKK